MDVAAYVALARPKHWIKNGFVFMPLPHALASGGNFEVLPFAFGLVGFCCANSAVYALNDCQDADQDRQHPKKKFRPVAAGRITPAAGRLFGLLLFLAALGLAFLSGRPGAVSITIAYVLINIVYSSWARSVALLDTFLLSSGFVLRVLLGCALVQVVPSNWLLLCSSTLALFLALAKRRGDLVRGVDAVHRPSLSGYNLPFLDQAIGVTSGMAIVAYALYCMESTVLVPGREFASLPFVVFGVFEYLRLVHVKDEGDSPVDVALHSRKLQACGVGWLVATLWGLPL